MKNYDGPSQPDSIEVLIEVFVFVQSRVACCPQSSRIVSRLAKHGGYGTRLHVA